MYRLKWQLQRLKNLAHLLEEINYNEDICIKNGDFINVYSDLELNKFFEFHSAYNDKFDININYYDEIFFDFGNELKHNLRMFIKSFENYMDFWHSIQHKQSWWNIVPNSQKWKILKRNSASTLPILKQYLRDVGITSM